ncbi:MAG: phosphatidylinositol-specific phospholipase C/glycerophosphodiester phosphodiesterase family protein [Cyclobacteriaceae bacterium]
MNQPPCKPSFLCVLIFICCQFSIPTSLGQDIRIHSHNDYLRNVPFWEAYANEAASIEADVILKNGILYVAHEEESILPEQTFTSLYLQPILNAKKLKIGNLKPFILLVDFKTEAYATMDQLIKEIQPFAELWQDPKKPLIKIVVSGNRPDLEDYHLYPFPLFFDYQSLENTTNLPLEKIAMISLNFRKFSQWNGNGRLAEEDLEQISKAIKMAHQLEKPIRFWATPDSKTAWKAFKELGVDFINTDQPYEASRYLNNIQER